MKDISFSTIHELRSYLDEKKISQEELLNYFIDRFDRFDKEVGSALEIFDKESLVKNFKEQGLLAGIPGLIKDNICQAGRITACASKMLQNFRSTYSATACERVKEQGGILLGRANLDEFAMGSSTETSKLGRTKNPWDFSRVPGGSSGGSAAAVAAGLVPWSFGSDTGGSVRQPAAYCGIVGIKPTYGLVSRYGLIAYGSSLDQIGALTRSVKDNALVLSVIAGHDIKDSSSKFVEKKDYTEHLSPELPHGLRIGVIDNAVQAEGNNPEIIEAIERSIETLQTLGAKVKRVTIPTMDYSAAAYFILSRAEAASNLARFDGIRYGMRDKKAESLSALYSNTRHDGFGPEVKSRIMVGNYVLSSGHAGEFYENAKIVKRLIRRDFLNAFKEVDLLLMPTHPAPAFKFGAFDVDKLQMDLQDYFTCPMNMAGIPAISIPCGFTKNNLPIGMQLIGSHFSEELIYQAAYAFESATEWHTMHPKGF